MWRRSKAAGGAGSATAVHPVPESVERNSPSEQAARTSPRPTAIAQVRADRENPAPGEAGRSTTGEAAGKEQPGTVERHPRLDLSPLVERIGHGDWILPFGEIGHAGKHRADTMLHQAIVQRLEMVDQQLIEQKLDNDGISAVAQVKNVLQVSIESLELDGMKGAENPTHVLRPDGRGKFIRMHFQVALQGDAMALIDQPAE